VGDVPATSAFVDFEPAERAITTTGADILAALFGRGGESVWMQPLFCCDYGSNILLGSGSSSTSTASCWTCAS
jgi:hypothetical protein